MSMHEVRLKRLSSSLEAHREAPRAPRGLAWFLPSSGRGWPTTSTTASTLCSTTNHRAQRTPPRPIGGNTNTASLWCLKAVARCTTTDPRAHGPMGHPPTHPNPPTHELVPHIHTCHTWRKFEVSRCCFLVCALLLSPQSGAWCERQGAMRQYRVPATWKYMWLPQPKYSSNVHVAASRNVHACGRHSPNILAQILF